MSTRRALFFSFLGRYAGVLLGIVSSMVVSRLLSPAEIGVFSVTMVLIGFAQSLRELGAGQYLVQERELTPERTRATWTVLLAMGAVLAALVALAARPVAHFYDDPRMVNIMWVIALNFLVNPFGSMTHAWLTREMRFDALAVLRLGSALTGASLSIWLAWRDWGPISLALGNLASTTVNAALALRYRPPGFGWSLSLREARRVLGFGGRVSGTNIIFDFAISTPELLLGKLHSLAAAGLYSRSNGLAQMFQRLVLDATQAVATPLFAKNQRETRSIEEPFLRSLSYITVLGWPFLIGLALLAFPLTRVLYGGQWDASVPVTRMLAVAMMISLVASMAIPVLTGLGQAQKLLRVTTIVVPLQVLCAAAGAIYGLDGIGIGIVAGQVLAVPIWLSAIRPYIGFSWGALWRILIHSGKVACLTALAPLGAVTVFGLQPQSTASALLCATIGGLALFLLAIRVFRHPIQREVGHLLAIIGSSFARRFG